MMYERAKELVFGKKPAQIQHLFTLRDQIQVQETVVQRSLQVRARLTILFNCIRIFDVLLIILFSSFLAGNYKPLIWQANFDTREQVLIIGLSYALLLLLLVFWAWKRRRKQISDIFY